jgi:hypothetical protein
MKNRKLKMMNRIISLYKKKKRSMTKNKIMWTRIKMKVKMMKQREPMEQMAQLKKRKKEIVSFYFEIKYQLIYCREKKGSVIILIKRIG